MTSNMFTLNFDEATTKLHVTSMNHSSPNVTTSTLTTTAATFDQTPSTSATIGEPVTASADLTSDGIWHVAVIVAFLSVIVMSIVGNGLVVLTIFTCRRMRSVTNYFIVSLSGADLLMAVGIPFALVANWFERRWPFGAVLCPVITYLQSVAVFLSAFTMVGLSIDRFRAVVFPLRPRITGRQAAVAIGNIWLLAASVPLPVAIVSQVDPDSGFCVEQWPYSTWQHAFTMTLLVLQYFLPLGVLAVTYATICYVIWVKRSPGEVLQNGRDRRIALAKRKSIKMMIVVVVVYALCWMPLHVVTLLGDMRPSIWNYEHIQPVWIGSYWLAMSSCCWNPIIYCWKNDTFRAGFQYALLGRCPCRSLRRRSCHLFDKQPAFSPSMAAAAAPFCLAPRVRNANWSSASAACGRPRLSRAAAARVARGGSIRIIAAQVARVGVPSTSSSVGGYACVESVLAKSNPVSLPLSVDGGGELDETGLTNTGRKPIFRQAAETGLNRSKPKVRGAKNRGRQLCRPSLTRKLNYQTTTTTKTLP